MKKIIFILSAILIISIFSSCTDKNNEIVDEDDTATTTISETSDTELEIQTEPIETIETEEEIAIVHDSYDTKELSRDGNYKLMEMYAYDNDMKLTRRVTFELPVNWVPNIDSSSFGLIQDEHYVIKFDIWDIINATKENIIDVTDFGGLEVIDEGSFSTDNYEFFWVKYNSEISIITSYYLYANDERLHVSTYDFTGEDNPEHEAIFKRIVESIQFQF